MSKYFDYEEFDYAMEWEAGEYYDDYVFEDIYYDEEEQKEREEQEKEEREEREEREHLLGPKIFWIKLIQRHWKKTFNSNKKYNGMLSIYKL